MAKATQIKDTGADGGPAGAPPVSSPPPNTSPLASDALVDENGLARATVRDETSEGTKADTAAVYITRAEFEAYKAEVAAQYTVAGVQRAVREHLDNFRAEQNAVIDSRARAVAVSVVQDAARGGVAGPSSAP